MPERDAPAAPVVSILIVTKDRAEDLRHTLRALAKLAVPIDAPAELLVVDNGSSDHTPAVIDAERPPNLPTRHVRDLSCGKTAALNNALAEARGRVLLFTDDDVRPPADWVERMSRPILCGRADAVAGAIRAAPHLAKPWVTSAHLNWMACTDSPAGPPEREVSQAEGAPYLVGANMAFDRRVLARVPGFDPEIGAGARGNGEDTIFSMQLERAGFRRVFLPGVAVEHHFDPARLTRAAFERQADRRGELDAYLKHHWFQTPSRLPRLRLAQLKVNYRLRRLAGWRPGRTGEIAAWELPLLEGVALYRHYLAERHRPFAYERHGLRKLSAGGPPAEPHIGLAAPEIAP